VESITGLQYIRKFNLLLADDSGQGLDFSGLKVVFSIKKTDHQTPNTADIRIYNLNQMTVEKAKKEFTRVVVQAGYESNFGVIFDGTVKQYRTGKENSTDTYLDISAGDGDVAYNYAVVNGTLHAGATQLEQIQLATLTMQQQGGIRPGFISNDIAGAPLARGKVMYGPARDYVRQSARSSGATWSIQDGKLQVLKTGELLPVQAVYLNSKTGLVGTPEQTNDGIKARCLLNPMLKIGSKIKINEASIQTAKLPDTTKDAAPNKMPSIAADGAYRILSIDFTGDTFGNDWYCDFICIDVDEAAPVKKQVKDAED